MFIVTITTTILIIVTPKDWIVHYHHDHLAEEDAIVHLLIHVRTVFLQWKFVVHILTVIESNRF